MLQDVSAGVRCPMRCSSVQRLQPNVRRIPVGTLTIPCLLLVFSFPTKKQQAVKRAAAHLCRGFCLRQNIYLRREHRNGGKNPVVNCECALRCAVDRLTASADRRNVVSRPEKPNAVADAVPGKSANLKPGPATAYACPGRKPKGAREVVTADFFRRRITFARKARKL